MNNAIELTRYKNFRGILQPPFNIYIHDNLITRVGVTARTPQKQKIHSRKTLNLFISALIKYFPQRYKGKAQFKLYEYSY